MRMRYLIDLENVTNQNLVNNALEKWGVKVTENSGRSFVVEGPSWTSIDLARIWNGIGQGGHIFVFDLESGKEYSHRKIAQANKSFRVPDDALDNRTIELILQYQKTAGL